jgi:PST family polysaccharide transporter
MYAVQVSGYLLPLITLPYLARVLTPARFGLVAYAQDFVWYFVLLCDYGFGITATRQIAIHSDDSAAVSRIFSTVMTAKVCLMTVGFAGLNAVVFAVPKFRAEWPLFNIAYLTVAAYVAFPVWFFQGLQKMEYVGARDIFAKLAVLAAVLLFVHRESDYLLAAAIQSGGLLFSGLLGLAAVPFAAPVRVVRPTIEELRATFTEGWRVFASMFLTSSCAPTNVVILGLVASPAQVGYYSAASRIIWPLRSLVGPLTTALYPHISHLASQAPERALRFLRRYALLLSLPFLLLGLAVVLGAPLGVPLYYGNGYAETVILLQVMGLSPFLVALGQCFSSYYMLAFGFTREWSRITALAALLNLLSLALLLWLVRPTVAASLTMLVTDSFVLLASYRFYAARTADGRESSGG